MAEDAPSNPEIAARLEEAADLLEQQEANPHRVRSYRNAADRLRGLDRPAAELLEEGGVEALKEFRGIGHKLAGSIQELVETGRFGLLQRLREETDPEAQLAEVPGLGPILARRVHDELGVESLAELERAAHDGRLAAVDGIGEEKAEGIADALAGMLSRAARRRARHRAAAGAGADEGGAPPAATLLDVDREYRRRAAAGELRTIAPRRFNPEGKAWLPVLETERDGWSFTALYSNTARAHELGKTGDWVVIYYENGEEDQCTVVTARRGDLQGKRVIRGREEECRRAHAPG
jgi:hypothetical protein